MSWDPAYRQLLPHVVHISTPDGFGTGFLCHFNADKSIVGIATAWHVIREADIWHKPIRIFHPQSAQSTFLNADERLVYADQTADSAVILFRSERISLPGEPLPLFPIQSQMPIGAEVGWIGFPVIAPPETPCFFCGTISAHLASNAYFVDGVAINGVSGGPVVYNDGTLQIVGVVTEYHDNRSLPGLLVAQDVSNFHLLIQSARSITD